MRVRTPAAAGMFYPEEPAMLRQVMRECFLHEYGPGDIPAQEGVLGVICPHAGYMYSGPVACHSMRAISSRPYDLFIVVGPNHWGLGRDVASMRDCRWETPLGHVDVDSESADMLAEFSTAEPDFFAHTKEHSIEVQIPMLQAVFTNKFKILPIVMIKQDKETAKDVGRAVAGIARKKNAMIIGSSDLTHYEPNEFAHEQDHALMDAVLKMDIDEFYRVLEERQVSACGYGAIAATMAACRELGASKGRLLKYATSGDISGEKTSVVGYGSMIFS